MFKPSNRTCGGCTACCFTHGVQSNDRTMFKTERTPCVHCEEGVGCKVYNSPEKPMACDTFWCVWLLGLGGEDDRPDKSGVVVTWNTSDDLRRLHLTEFEAGALESDFALRVTAGFVQKGTIPVLYMYRDGRKKLVVKPEANFSLEEVAALRERGLEVEYFRHQIVVEPQDLVNPAA